MSNKTLKSELVHWINDLHDPEIIEYLKLFKDSVSCVEESGTNEITYGLNRGLKDIEEGNITVHDEVKKKYGL